MPFTIAAFITRKPEVSPTDFATHYDETHIPLLKSLVGDAFPESITRYYVRRAKSDPSGLTPLVFGGSAADFDYDVVSIMTFADEPAAQKFQQKYGEPEIQAKLGGDMAKFQVLEKLRVIAFQDPVVSS
ncbi:hypothetical protein K469DRAFT_720626 [Zopfia rhizophila CBS 207.26]|uniref:EthD domain-containing protein n=1 Tax=Zopfia rhizophila CBS 207.26 TaxID=1314779 RepID=A0A6A6EKV6_9PEZI|nr:hypothetical protein K469DRAFT_720626 [Zopfia rhizophila CBS 207.26]